MNILLLLVPISVVLLGIAIAAFIWAVRHGQFDDLQTPPLDMLGDAPPRAELPDQRRDDRRDDAG
jgi:cbb3-type cytochrome oxidase maturation protein